MKIPSAEAPVSFKRRAVRTVAVLLLLAATGLIAGEWVAEDLGVAPGRMIAAGLALCVAGNLLSVLLLIGWRREYEERAGYDEYDEFDDQARRR